MRQRALLVVAMGWACSKPAELPAQRGPDSVEAPESEHVLIAHAGYLDDVRVHHGARLITAPDEIRWWKTMVIENQVPPVRSGDTVTYSLGHRCGYHWQVVAGRGAEVLGSRKVNVSCEKFGHDGSQVLARVREVGAEINAAPTHFLYSLVVRASVVPQQVRSDLRRDQTIGYVTEADREPRVTISLTTPDETSVEPAVDKLIAAIRREYRITGGSQTGSTWAANDGPQIGADLEIRFAYGTDVRGLETLVAAHGGTLGEISIATTYSVCVVTREPELDHARANLLARYPYIVNVEPCIRSLDQAVDNDIAPN